MALRLTQFPFEFSDRTTESSTEENLTQLQHGEVSVHTALQAWQERGCSPRWKVCMTLSTHLS